jgi:uncharacterized protein (DUF2236 family)
VTETLEGRGATLHPFVPAGSIVRRIWGDADAVLFVFAGAAAEFALNRAVDWLFFTGAIPSDPIGRLFRTAAYAQDIVFASRASAAHSLQRIRAAHEAVERSRGARIPDWAHRDVLYLLIDYSERAWALLHGGITDPERDDLYDVFRRVGEGLAIPELPVTYAAWQLDRERHMRRDLVFSRHTAALYARYRRQLGPWRYRLLREVQSLLVPPIVADLLRLPRARWTRPAVGAYRALRRLGLASVARLALVPPKFLGQVGELDRLGPRGGAGKPLISSIDPRTAAESTRRTPTFDSTSRSAPGCPHAAASANRRGG